MMELSSPASPRFSANISLPGSKSISNRLLLLRAASGTSFAITGLSTAHDTQVLEKALQEIQGSAAATIDIGPAGTAFRFLTALLACTPGQWLLTGSKRMKERPIAPLVDALRQLGASVEYRGEAGYPPLFIRGHRLAGGQVAVDAQVSSQFISALLLVSPLLKEGLHVRLIGKQVSVPYLTMTCDLLRGFGVSVDYAGDSIAVDASGFTPHAAVVESDWSAASYWFAISALNPGSRISLSTLRANSLQGDSILPVLFEPFGVTVKQVGDKLELASSGVRPSRFEFDFIAHPDLAQTMAVLCFACGVPATLRGLWTLKIKETDRLAALERQLIAFGAQVQASETELIVNGCATKMQDGPVVQTENDHRMAMAFAPLSCITGTIRFDDPSVVNKSYPQFWEHLSSVGFRLNLQPPDGLFRNR